jgi:hypothetical protein
MKGVDIMHPLYYRCLGLVNRPVTVHLVSGHSHYGMIQRVTPQGIHFTPLTRPVSSSKGEHDLNITTTEKTELDNNECEQVFFPFFFPFALLAGFTLGFAAGASPFFW